MKPDEVTFFYSGKTDRDLSDEINCKYTSTLKVA